MAQKDRWNALPPSDDKLFAQHVAHPELATLLPALYPGVFPNLAALDAVGSARADMLRLNTAIPPSASPDNLGLLGGDLAGFPNGRRVPTTSSPSNCAPSPE